MVGPILTKFGTVKHFDIVSINDTNIDIQAMLVWLTLPFYDFCGFRSVAVNSVYKLQFFTFITITFSPINQSYTHKVR